MEEAQEGLVQSPCLFVYGAENFRWVEQAGGLMLFTWQLLSGFKADYALWGGETQRALYANHSAWLPRS